MNATARWEHFPHQADIGVRGLGATPEQAFEQAALALTAVITDPADVVPREMLRLSCDAPDVELLLVDWLAEEAPGAYKDVSAVVDAADHAGLARKVARVRPLICIKG